MIDSSTPIDFAVIGCGPAGLMAAITAARNGRSVTLFERMGQPALKLMATGGGNCNLTNTLDEETFMRAFGRQGRFMSDALYSFNADALREFMAELGIKTKVTEDLYVWPEDGARVLAERLLRECTDLGVSLCLNSPINRIYLSDGRVDRIACDRFEVPVKNVLIATGGRGYSKLGGCGIGYDLAQQAGHKVVTPIAADVPLVTAEKWPTDLTGIVMPNVHLLVEHKGFPKAGEIGDLLFTHRGISGPMIVNLSGAISSALLQSESVQLRVNFMPKSFDAVAEFAKWRTKEGKKLLSNHLKTILPNAMADIFCELCDIPLKMKASELSRQQADQLEELLTKCPLNIPRTEGFEKAMVTRGGVSLKEVDPGTLQSKLVEGLYFAGEVLDLDAPCGGYNLQWAFSSGFMAGNAV
jgi:predicted Rossmann fold flavoprotein